MVAEKERGIITARLPAESRHTWGWPARNEKSGGEVAGLRTQETVEDAAESGSLLNEFCMASLVILFC